MVYLTVLVDNVGTELKHIVEKRVNLTMQKCSAKPT